MDMKIRRLAVMDRCARLASSVALVAAFGAQGAQGAQSAQSAQVALPSYDCKRLDDVPGRGGSFPAALNNGGEAVGATSDYFATEHWNKRRQVVELERPGFAYYTPAHDINDSGFIVGTSFIGGPYPTQAAVQWKDGALSYLDEYFDGTTYADGINNKAEVAGARLPTGGKLEAVVWRNGQAKSLPPAQQGDEAAAHAINNLGDLVGVSYASGTEAWRAVRWHAGQVVALPGLPGAEWSNAAALNDDVVVVGSSGATLGARRPTAWRNDTATALPLMPGFDGGEARAVNRAGEIVGVMSAAAGSRAAYWASDWLKAVNLNRLVKGQPCTDPQGAAVTLSDAVDINNNGVVLAYGWWRDTGGVNHPVGFKLTLVVP